MARWLQRGSRMDAVTKAHGLRWALLTLLVSGCVAAPEGGASEEPGMGAKADGDPAPGARTELFSLGQLPCDAEPLQRVDKSVDVPAAISESGADEVFDMYAVCHHNRWRIPLWVAEEVTPSMVGGPIGRTDKFVADEALPEDARAQLEDYRSIARKGYHRGHMAPAANYQPRVIGKVTAPLLIGEDGEDVSSRGPRVCDEDESAYDAVACADWNAFVGSEEGALFVEVGTEIMDKTFPLTNMAPQAPDLNSQVWRYLESDIRDAVESGATAWIVTGNLFLATPRGERLAPVADASSFAVVDPEDPPVLEGDADEDERWSRYRWVRAEEVDGAPAWRAPGTTLDDGFVAGHVAVPTHCYKVLVLEATDTGQSTAYGFVLPNPDPWAVDDSVRKLPLRDPEDYQVPVDLVEELTGFDFFSLADLDEGGLPAWPPAK